MIHLVGHLRIDGKFRADIISIKNYDDVFTRINYYNKMGYEMYCVGDKQKTSETVDRWNQMALETDKYLTKTSRDLFWKKEGIC